MNKVIFYIKESWLLLAASLVFGTLLAGYSSFCDPFIVKNEIKKFNDNAGAMVPEGTSFESVEADLSFKLGGKNIKPVLKRGVLDGKTVAWAFVAEGSGYADKIKLVIVVDAGYENILGYGVLFSNETPGFGDKIKLDYYKSQYEKIPAGPIVLEKVGDPEIKDNTIIAITGATVSSDAVVSIFNNYITQVKTLMKEKGLL